MAWVRRVLTYVTVWGGATTLAMLLVWFAARPVLRGAVFGEPPARTVVRDPPSSPPSPPSPLPSAPPPADSSTVATASPSPAPSRSPSPAPATHDRTYVTRGGRVVLALTATAAHLVSATPNPGYEVNIWRGDGWLRVDFRRERQDSSLWATWNGHPPSVQVEN